MQTANVLSFPTSDDMALSLNKDDKHWIQTQIRDGAKPEPAKIAWGIKEWSLVGIFVAIVIGLVAACVALWIFAASGMKENATFQGRTEARLTSIEASLVKLNSRFDGLKLQQIGGNPANPENIAEAKKVLTAAVS